MSMSERWIAGGGPANDLVDAGKSDDYENDGSENGLSKDGGDEVEVRRADQTPVQGADDHKDRGKNIERFHNRLLWRSVWRDNRFTGPSKSSKSVTSLSRYSGMSTVKSSKSFKCTS